MKLTVVTTDFGADCDDQKAVSGLIAGLKAGEEVAFIVSGPQPRMAAAAIAEAYHAKTGHYPLIALGKQFEGDKVPEDRIYSPASGEPITIRSSFIDRELVPLEQFQERIDNKIKAGDIATFEQITLAPLHSSLEHYHPNLRFGTDPVLAEAWKGIGNKISTTQFQRDEDGTYKGNNYQKSAPGIADGYNTMLEEQGFARTYFEGAVAKRPEFLITVKQPQLAGIEKSAETYMEAMQVPWASMPGKPGTTPTVEDMHVGMFIPAAEVPFGVHVSGKNPAGFGVERLMREACGIPPEDPRYNGSVAPIKAELERFDGQVLAVLQQTHPDIVDVQQMRTELHHGMMDTLQKFAQEKGRGEPPPNNFNDLFDRAQAEGKPLNPFGYMKEFETLLFHEHPLVKDIAAVANAEKDRRIDDKSHMETMASLLGQQGARATMYDAVAVEASRTVENNPQLCKHFMEKDTGIINITRKAVDQLRQTNPDLFRTFQLGIVSGLERDGGRTDLDGPRYSIVIA